MTERQIYAFNRLCVSWLNHPELKDKNIQILNSYGIDYNKCKTGPGFDELGVNLEEKLEAIKEMGLLDEVLSNPSDALEIIRGASMKLNYNDSKNKGAQYVKDAA